MVVGLNTDFEVSFSSVFSVFFVSIDSDLKYIIEANVSNDIDIDYNYANHDIIDDESNVAETADRFSATVANSSNEFVTG